MQSASAQKISHQWPFALPCMLIYSQRNKNKVRVMEDALAATQPLQLQQPARKYKTTLWFKLINSLTVWLMADEAQTTHECI